jgi:hypothetical protein
MLKDTEHSRTVQFNWSFANGDREEIGDVTHSNTTPSESIETSRELFENEFRIRIWLPGKPEKLSSACSVCEDE